jgi:hypothetical protein
VGGQQPKRTAIWVAALDQLTGASHRTWYPQVAQYQPNRGGGTSRRSVTSVIWLDAGRHSNQRDSLHAAQ